jgi:hypothetical protein
MYHLSTIAYHADMRPSPPQVLLGLVLGLGSLQAIGCSSGTNTDPGSGGAGAATGGRSPTGGTATGGAAATGGATGGGQTGGKGGVTGGATGTGGAGATGGATGTGGAATGGQGSAGGGGGGSGTACPTANEEKFSFFLISNAELIRQGGADSSGMFSKFGGNFGGLEGADRICQKAAEHVSPCQSKKVWRAFLSTTSVDAIDRIGKGPWFDRLGRQWASSLTTLVGDRPTDADPAIKNDIPNETGTKNQNPDGTGNVDNHEILTGSGPDGRLYKQSASADDGGFGGSGTSCGPDVGGTGNTWSAERATCWNWTRNTPEGCPRVGHSWCINASCTPPGSSSGTNWLSVWNENGCQAGGVLTQTNFPAGSRAVGAYGGYGGFYCFAVMPQP